MKKSKSETNQQKNFNFENLHADINKAVKYYISFRILNRCSLHLQSMKCLLFSIETYLKLSDTIKNKEYNENELKKIGHNLKKAFEKTELDKEKYPKIYMIISEYHYNNVRYVTADFTNWINLRDKNLSFPILEELDSEIKNLHNITADEIRKTLNLKNKIYGQGMFHGYNKNEMDSTKRYIIDTAMKEGDPTFIFDNS